MRAPTPSEPKSTFPTYQVPQVSAMRGSAPPVQVARAAWGDRADPLSQPCVSRDASSVINGSSCLSQGNSNIRMQSVTENCLLNSVTVPKIQRNDHIMVAHNNSDKLVSKFGALSLGRDIPNQKSDDLEVLDLNALKNLTAKNDINRCNNNDDEFYYCRQRFHSCDQYLFPNIDNHIQNGKKGFCQFRITSNQELRDEILLFSPPLRLRGGGEGSLSTGTSGWGTPPSQQASNNNSKWYYKGGTVTLKKFF